MLTFLGSIFFVLPIVICVLTMVARGYTKDLEKDLYYMPASFKDLVNLCFLVAVVGFVVIGLVNQPLFEDEVYYWVVGGLIVVIGWVVSGHALQKPLKARE